MPRLRVPYLQNGCTTPRLGCNVLVRLRPLTLFPARERRSAVPQIKSGRFLRSPGRRFPFQRIGVATFEIAGELLPSRVRVGRGDHLVCSSRFWEEAGRPYLYYSALVVARCRGARGFGGREMEPMDIVGKSKEDVSLPKATMFKIIKEMLPPDVRVARDAQDLLVECCVEFINLVSSESNEVCSREDKRTIAPEHVLQALQDLGFGEYIEEVYAAYEQHKLELMDSPKGGKWNGAEMTEEEALAEQQRMFAEARARMNNGMTKPSDTGSTES